LSQLQKGFGGLPSPQNMPGELAICFAGERRGEGADTSKRGRVQLRDKNLFGVGLGRFCNGLAYFTIFTFFFFFGFTSVLGAMS
jgi:hypothetical protein